MGWLVLGSVRFLVVRNLARRVVGCAVSEWLMTSIGTIVLNWGANAGYVRVETWWIWVLVWAGARCNASLGDKIGLWFDRKIALQIQE